ncbi:NirD/YgiW/YdeI family stress tolerance protein [Stutzerimonas stutzeri]|uniref:NirD/YgiW/YdeI family stress tolerance protein n=1 Tax=Stutzerimonas stutzeri TaxID=316 RepID=UPI0002FADF16|nr:NirD/YgiW/YdeI family stress tolerance protein [Stutzerimonas stutzeri]
MSTITKTLIATAIAGFATAPLAAESGNAPSPYQKHDGTWISLNGTVESVKPDSFMLDYGKGSIIVEMDDWDWYSEGTALKAGDKVTVYGDVDDDIFEVTSIEANSVYVEGLNSFFFASANDEETPWRTATFVPSAETTIQGTVQSVKDRELTLDTGDGSLIINTLTMSYNPLDKDGFQQVEKGDRISVMGQMDPAFFGNREFNAKSIITISDDSQQQQNS